MTYDRTQPPNDELMVQVLKIIHGIDIPVVTTYSTVVPCPIVSLTPLGCCVVDVVDPRTDTNAALDLLHWVLGEYENKEQYAGFYLERGNRGMWDIMRHFEGDSFPKEYKANIPISGQPMRTAVCWLAVDVMLGGG